MHLWELNLSFAGVMTRREQDGAGEGEKQIPSGDTVMGTNYSSVLTALWLLPPWKQGESLLAIQNCTQPREITSAQSPISSFLMKV